MRHHLLVVAIAALIASSRLASAGPSAPSTPVALVNDKLLEPLAAKDHSRSKFSRAAPPPSLRRARVLDEKPQQDTAGGSFFAFAVDEHHGWGDDESEDTWSKATITGCVYPDRGEVFIKRGDAYQPAAAALGKKTKAAPDSTCHAAAQVTER